MKKQARLIENDPLTATDKVLSGYEQFNKPERQQSDQSASQQVNTSESKEVSKPAIRKSTFQLSEEVLQRLDTFHLQLQLELGKANAPYKEVIVEAAIAHLLNTEDREGLIRTLQKRQQQRNQT
uniref:Uncharacterized protein n=1 Tax=Cyanothece sp. (strain PCC 7425 / ATCC 29141) TaxID=395961 RepID=B8HZ86_CYAP4